MTADQVAVFFYGLFMDESVLTSKGVRPGSSTMGYVDGFSLLIGNRATLVPDPDGRAYGVLMTISSADAALLYADTSVADYEPEPVSVTLPDGSVAPAVCYNLPGAVSQASNKSYAQALLKLACKMNFPDDYLAQIRAATTQQNRQPSISTQRLVLRPYSLLDAPDVQRLAGDRDIADTTLRIPHPYEDGMAEEWISGLQRGFDAGDQATFAIVNEKSAQLLGAIGLTIERDSDSAELGYWIGKPYWNNGYATEAAKAIVQYGFTVLRLCEISAQHLLRNPSSGRVMQKVGMTCEGQAPEGTVKWDRHEDLLRYRLTREDWERAATRNA